MHAHSCCTCDLFEAAIVCIWIIYLFLQHNWICVPIDSPPLLGRFDHLEVLSSYNKFVTSHPFRLVLVKTLVTPLLPSSSLISGSSIIDFSSSAADRYIDPLSETIILGKDLRPANLQKASINVLAVRSWTISKWTTCVVACVNRHKYTFEVEQGQEQDMVSHFPTKKISG